VLEYVNNVDRVYSEIERVAGADENIFVVYIKPEARLTHEFYRPKGKHVITCAPPAGPFSHKLNALDERSIVAR